MAAQCNLISHDAIFGFKTTYDENLSEYSPGVQLNIEALRRFHERDDLNLFDSCTQPSNLMINRYWPDRRLIATRTIATPRARGRLALRGVRAVKQLREGPVGRRVRAVRRRRMGAHRTT